MRLLLKLVINSLALIITANLVFGFHIESVRVAIVAAIVLAIINITIKPLLLFLTAPINFMTLGLFTFVVNAVLLSLASVFVPGLVIESFLSAVVAALVLSVVSTILSTAAVDLARVGKSKKRRKKRAK